MSRPPTRLWDKGVEPDALVYRFTVGDDPHWDAHLVPWDCLGSAAHARTLARAGLLTADELAALLAGLAEIVAEHAAGRFPVPPELEDCHTAIEVHLTRRCGAAGEKIHTGRSRNDQVATAMRLLMRHHALGWMDRLAELGGAALVRLERDGEVPMPGYTHLQPAMPSSVGQWLHALIEAVLEQMRATLDLLERLDSCPLGTGAGFGVPLPLDRAYTAALLGFGRVQRSPLDVQNSRGRLEKYFVRVAADVGAVLEKLACDLLLFSTVEFGFFGLPESMTTGSSIMPQKRNPDVLELLRGRGARLRARVAEVEWVAAKLPSSYHRDLQLTKEPAVRAALELDDMVRIATRVIAEFTICRERLAAAMGSELYATHAALALVRAGVPFREAYRRVAEALRAARLGGTPWQPPAVAAVPGPAGLADTLAAELRELRERSARARGKAAAAEAALLAPAGYAPPPEPVHYPPTSAAGGGAEGGSDAQGP